MVDVVPELNEAIQRDFQRYVEKDRRIATISKRIRDGTAKLVEGHDYAERLGENLSASLVKNLTAEKLPNGRLYYNIAKRIVVPNLRENYNLTNDVVAEIQKIVDESLDIGLNAIRADFPEERIQGLIDKMTVEDIPLERAVIWLKEPIINNSEAFFDDYIKANAKFRNDAGLKTTLTRTVVGGCCDWCRNLAGVYDYGDAPADIYRRHEFCRCTVTYQSEKTSQNVWTKKTWETTSEELDRRKDTGLIPKMTKAEQKSRIGQIERDIEIKNFREQTGYSRETASRTIRNKTPEQIQAEIKKILERQEKIKRR